MEESGECLDIITLQEVGGISALPVVQNYDGGIAQITMHECNDIHDYHAFSCSQLSSHLSQVILISKDCVDHISGCWKGDRLLGVDVVCAGSMRRLTLVGCHLPHQDNTDDIFQASLREIKDLQRCMNNKNTPCVIMGDFNAETSSLRGIQLCSAASSLGGRVLQSFQPTRFGRCSETELDYFMVNRPLNDTILPQAATVEIATIQHSHLAIGSDHDCVCLELVLRDPAHLVKRAKRRRYRQFKCRRHSVAQEPLHADLRATSDTFAQQTSVQQWETLSRLSERHSFAAPSLKYKDPPGIKQLCQERRATHDPLERARVTKVIIAARHEARRRWMQDLYDKSEQGDPSAIRYLRQRGSQMHTNTEDFVTNSGGEQASIHNMKQHYSNLFGKEPDPIEKESLEKTLQTLVDRAAQCPPELFTVAEVQPALERLKRGKVSGISGMSNEFLTAVWCIEEDQTMLVSHLNQLLMSQDLPDELLQAYVCLIPKTHRILECKDFRPINLLEVIHKVFAWLLVSYLKKPLVHFDVDVNRAGPSFPGKEELLAAAADARQYLEKIDQEAPGEIDPERPGERGGGDEAAMPWSAVNLHKRTTSKQLRAPSVPENAAMKKKPCAPFGAAVRPFGRLPATPVANLVRQTERDTTAAEVGGEKLALIPPGIGSIRRLWEQRCAEEEPLPESDGSPPCAARYSELAAAVLLRSEACEFDNAAFAGTFIAVIR
ncbi:hypothetical protein AK812_SmicGene1302 [Symbiodinium microadriaticum]|uniref:Endonuclease/exonuclease/phosphatase domain-containing protein n=1 Tax=Symbiodinium microadriaticum TaxID=2951 RepID=A0A1Q9F4C3_SYMMI|nr:hypothetical protein AK812_SmicGene1302 [Symbiodinium microadriaticum]CAE7242416.1 unnamed protein product [Symbiodinium microadriaticum]